MFQKQIAQKEQVKLMIALSGPSGAGKTFSALQLAHGITQDWSKIALADTENRSSLYYAGEKTGPWQHIDFPPTLKGGYHPNNWIQLISFAENDPNVEVLILDSISHEWEAQGGALDLNQQMGGRFTDWAKVTPVHRSFVDKMRSSRLHIIATMRSKTDYAIEKDERGKNTVTKMGLKAIQREGMDYEFGIVFDVAISHHATAVKDRTGLFVGRSPFYISGQTGQELLSWSKDAKPIETAKKQFPFKKDHPKAQEMLKKAMKDREIPDEKYAQLADALDGQPWTKETLDAALEALNKASEVEKIFETKNVQDLR